MKKALSLILCLAMICGLFAMSAIGVSAEETELVKSVLYDFEGDTLPTGITYSQMRSNHTGLTDTNYYNGQKSFMFHNSKAMWNNMSKNVPADAMSSYSYVRIAIPDDINVLGSVGFAFCPNSQNTSAYQAFGVEMADGTYYFTKYSTDKTYPTKQWTDINLMTQTFYKLGDTSVTKALTAADFSQSAENKVVALVISDGGTADNTEIYRTFIDDVYYETAEASTPTTAPKATFDNGVADVEAVDGVVTMPEATIEGKQFIGWQDVQGNLYQAGAQVEIAEDTAFTAVSAAVELQTGAGIRWAKEENERGIRFETTVSKDALDALGSSKFELGALILPYADYDADITVETATDYGALNVVDPKVYGEVEDNYRYYTGVVDFEKYFAVSGAALADLKLTAVSYVKVTYADGTNAYFYDMPDATDNVRTVSEVARAALADTDFGYTDDQVAILELYTEYSAETTVPEYRKDDADKIQ